MRCAFVGGALALAVTLSACSEQAQQKPAPAETPAASAPAPPKAVSPRTPLPPPGVVDQAFGHYAYAEGDGLVDNVCRHGTPERTRLRPEAARALKAMVEAALEDGVDLNPSSCFRSVESQRAIFECSGGGGAGCADGRLVDAAARASAVAPPGFSEHATGYAVDFFPGEADLGDGGCPTREACTTAPLFGGSRSGLWLAHNARAFGFEQSFYPGSTQGVMPEPWHYRFIGSPEAEAVFRTARSRHPPP